MKRTGKIAIFVVIALVILGVGGYLNRVRIEELINPPQQVDLPVATNLNAILANGNQTNTNQENANSQNTNSANANSNANANTNTNPPVAVVIPVEFNLDIPFTSQAPFGNWDATHEEYCEEASLVMANRFVTNRGISGSQDADDAMNAMKDWEVEHFGYFESTTAEETATIAREYLGLQAKVVKEFTWDDAKRELLQGHVVILPSAGRELGNPNFTGLGPIYHMLVVRGWTTTKIITNDPGTRRGEEYVYDPTVLYNAIGDYNHNDPAHGATVMIVVWK